MKKYMSSGVLAHYVLGLLSEKERQEVERMASEHSEIRAELKAIEEALAGYAQANARPMPEGLSAKILNEIDDLSKKASPPSKGGFGKFLPSLLGILLVGAIAVLAMIYNRNNALHQELSQSQIAIDSLQQDSINCQSRINKLEQQLSILRSESNQTIFMKDPKGTRAIASVYYDDKKQTSFLDVINLPTPPPDKQYQLWAIVDGTPVDMGVFDVAIEPGAFQNVPFIENAQAFAVTLEPRGGSPVPTLEQMVAIGNVS